MRVSGVSFLIFVVVFLLISFLFLDSLVPHFAWAICWSAYVFADNMWWSIPEVLPEESLGVRGTAATQQQMARRGGLVDVPSTSTVQRSDVNRRANAARPITSSPSSTLGFNPAFNSMSANRSIPVMTPVSSLEEADLFERSRLS